MLGIMKKDLKELVSNKRIWISLVVVLIVVIISTTFVDKEQDNKGEVSTSVAIGILDLDQSMYSKLLLDYFVENEAFAAYITILTGTKEELDEKMKQNELDLYIVFPKNFVQDIVNIEHTPIQVFINASDTTKAILIKNLLQSYEKYIAAVEINCVTLYEVMELSQMPQDLIDEKNVKISYDLIFTAIGKDEFFKDMIIPDIATVPLATYYTYEVLYLLFCYLSVLLGISFLKEKKKGIYKRLLTTGYSMTAMVTGKIIVFAGVCQLTFLALSAIFNIVSGVGLMPQAVLFASLFLWCTCAFSVFLSACINNISTYLLSMNLIILFGAILGGGIIPLSYLPEELYRLASGMPNAWFIKEMIRLKVGGISGSMSVIISMLIAFVAFVLLSGLLYRRREAKADENL